MPHLPWIARRGNTRLRLARLARLGLCVGGLVAGAGGGAHAGPIADWFAAKMAPTPDASKPQAESLTDGRLMSRWMGNGRTPFSSGAMGATSVILGEKGWQKTKAAPDPQCEAEFTVAKKHFDAGDYKTAEALLGPLANREVKKGSPWGEKFQYYLAETQFRRQKYVASLDSFEVLHKKYPGTNHNDELVAREYQIAQIWLSDEDPKAKPLSWQSRLDGRQHLIDSHGYAVKALEHVREHDPTGPLADDAALRTADHYHTAGDYESAAIFYDQLLVEHAKSPYRERAQLSSIDAKMKAYIGPEYDVSGLEAAKDTIKRTMAEFPERQAGAEQLYHTLDLIDDQAAEREFVNGQYYVRARKPVSAEYQFGLVMAKWPRSKWAKLAKAEMGKIGKMPRKASVPSKIMSQPGAPDPNSVNGGSGSSIGGMGGMGGMGGGGGAGTGSPY